MSGKKIAFGARPTATMQPPPTPDAWVESRANQETAQETLKRLTLDIPARLHGRIKADCAVRGVKMVEELRVLLEERYGKN